MRKAQGAETAIFVVILLISFFMLAGGWRTALATQAAAAQTQDKIQTKQIATDIAVLDTYNRGILSYDFSEQPYETFRITGDHFIQTERVVGTGVSETESQTEEKVYIYPSTQLGPQELTDVGRLCIKKKQTKDGPQIRLEKLQGRERCRI